MGLLDKIFNQNSEENNVVDVNTQDVTENAEKIDGEILTSDEVVVEPVSDVEKNTSSQIDIVEDVETEQEIIDNIQEPKSEENNPVWTWESIVKEIEHVLDNYPTTEFTTLNLKNVIYGIIRKTL